MAYYNWGEQIGNSFMNMYAQNQQKRLEEARMGIEKERLGIERDKFADQQATSLLQRKAYQQEIDEIAEKNKMYEGLGTWSADLNGNKAIDDNEKNISYKFYNDLNKLAYGNQEYNVFNSKTGGYDLETKYARNEDRDYFAKLYGDKSQGMLGVWQTNQENAQRALDRATSSANARISANNNRSVERVGIIDSLDAEIEQMILANPDGWGQDADNRKKATDMLMYKYGSDPATEYYIRSKLYQLKKSNISSKAKPKVDQAKNGFTGGMGTGRKFEHI